MAKSLDSDEWPWFGVYLYRADGKYSKVVWAKTQEEFTKLLPKIARHVKKGLEVAITSMAMKCFFTLVAAVSHGMGLDWNPSWNVTLCSYGASAKSERCKLQGRGGAPLRGACEGVIDV